MEHGKAFKDDDNKGLEIVRYMKEKDGRVYPTYKIKKTYKADDGTYPESKTLFRRDLYILKTLIDKILLDGIDTREFEYEPRNNQ